MIPPVAAASSYPMVVLSSISLVNPPTSASSVSMAALSSPIGLANPPTAASPHPMAALSSVVLENPPTTASSQSLISPPSPDWPGEPSLHNFVDRGTVLQHQDKYPSMSGCRQRSDEAVRPSDPQ